MTEIKSKEVTVNCPQAELFTHLLDLTNFEELLPQDKISDWQADKDQCSFKIQNAATIQLVMESSVPNESIRLNSGDKSPFPFTLDIIINDTGEHTSFGHLLFQGSMNPFIKMIAAKPLAALFDHIADRLVDVKGGTESA